MRHQAPPTEWIDTYEYYGLQEMFTKVARVLQAGARYGALTAVHEELFTTIAANLPAEEDRPTVVLLGPNDLGSIYAYSLSTPGFLTAHTRSLRPVSASGDDVESRSTVDFETLLETNPDVILTLGGMHPNTSMPDVRTGLQDDPVGAEIPAVKNDRIYVQNGHYQEPIPNLSQSEVTAEQLSPDRFGVWPQYSEGPYPEIPEEEQLSNRQRITDIISGNL